MCGTISEPAVYDSMDDRSTSHSEQRPPRHFRAVPEDTEIRRPRVSPVTRCRLVLVVLAALATIAAEAADAAVFANLLRTEAHVGDSVRAEVDSWTATHHPPLYLISARASTDLTITRGAPQGPPYIRLRRIQWSESGTSRVTIRFRVPIVKRGRYRLVIYCESCTTGPWGSVIGSVNTLRVH